jgi:hypothetical protein
MILTPWIILIVILCVLASPATLREKSLRRFLIAMALSFAGVVLPLVVFLFSSFMEPDWKGACAYAWLDCFIVGKLALTPLVLLATAALYALEIIRVEKRIARWIVVGIFLGAIVASVCFVFGIVCIGFQVSTPKMWLLVPFYVAVWYSVRAVQLIKASDFNFWPNFISLIGSLPFWLASWYWSRSLYAALPDKAPDGCFIVTAAGCGHAEFVGPYFEVEHNGRRRLANQQLFTFWQLENLWRAQFPSSHALFRKIYNRVGPVVARRISSPWLADLTFIALKPVELLAKLTIATPGKIERFAKQKS